MTRAPLSSDRQITVGKGTSALEHLDVIVDPTTSGTVLSIGDGTRLGRFVTIWAAADVRIGSRVRTGDYVAVTDCWTPPGRHRGLGTPADPAPVSIGDDVYLGTSCFIGPGVTVGQGAHVSEGAVVFDDVPAGATVMGNPAGAVP